MILRNDDGTLKRYDEGGGSTKAVKASYDEDTALYAHAVGDFIYLNEHFYKVTVTIAVGDTIEDEVNVTSETGLTVDTPIYVSNLPGGGG